jgi:aryl carrier-like protein
VLGIPKDQIGRRDQFFDLGGTSLSALKLLIAVDRAVSFKDLADHPTLADLATLVEDRSLQLRTAPELLPSSSSRD